MVKNYSIVGSVINKYRRKIVKKKTKTDDLSLRRSCAILRYEVMQELDKIQYIVEEHIKRLLSEINIKKTSKVETKKTDKNKKVKTKKKK